ncbi:protein aurora borealis [Teleopsis dalmanni]|uniref:protein aurora borealis n=1 Tax=Teleopsis dalmanni TaxID=139649 RepID=UPI0018CE721B|nr:protein aurora borealis [Teleopsis dalmanni]
MDFEHITPQKCEMNLTNIYERGVKTSSPVNNETTPKTKITSNKNTKHPRTPKQNVFDSSGHKHIINTPPAKRFHRVKNPFEATWERLHLPMIESPSLFQRSTTPQLSSTQFEWSIEQVSSLKPAHLEPHETQFYDSPNPEYEAKAQSAISSFFKDQQVVPSPVDCPLRNQRIALSELHNITPITKPKRIRECSTQTELSLPVHLPPELEEALLPYFQPALANSSSYAEESMNSIYKSCFSKIDFKDTSMRRKLFDMHNVIVLDNENNDTDENSDSMTKEANSSRGHNYNNRKQLTTIAGKLDDDDTLDHSFINRTSMSPISHVDGFSSPRSNAAMHRSRLQMFQEDLQLSPIAASIPSNKENKSFQDNQRKVVSMESYRHKEFDNSLKNFDEANISIINKNKFTPDRSSSPILCLEERELCTDSFTAKVGQLKVDCSKKSKTQSKSLSSETDLFTHNETVEMLEAEEDDMQVSQLSLLSQCSSSNSDTPRAKRRSASRKNLSHSFTAKWLEELEEGEQKLVGKILINEPNDELKKMSCTTNNTDLNPIKDSLTKDDQANFYRTDSGFNEMTSASSSTILTTECELNADDAINLSNNCKKPTHQDIVICSTPSKSNL